MDSEFSKAQALVSFLGSQVDSSNKVTLGFYAPGIPKDGVLAVEFLLPPTDLVYSTLTNPRVFQFKRVLAPIARIEDYLFGVYTGVPIGSKNHPGALYTLLYLDQAGTIHRIKDPLAQSMPLGVMAPPEIYDMNTMLENRKDKDYFTTHYKTIYPDGSYRAKDIGSTLEIHVQTATREGTLAALTRLYKTIAQTITKNIQAQRDPYDQLTPEQLQYIGYNSIELMPEVPQAERNARGFGAFFVPETDLDTHHTQEMMQNLSKDSNPNHPSIDLGTLNVNVQKPDIQGWGYDVVIYGTAAVNPSILETNRPDEFLEFIETIHTMPLRPIGLALDSVLGHADFQGGLLLRTFDQPSTGQEGLKYIPSAYLKGPNMYGRDVNYEHPVVRAILLEMYRRKNDFGVDAIRVDGGQDFVKEIDPVTGLKVQDDEFLHSMATVVQNCAGIQRRLDINIEDGRPWPDDINWIYNSTYQCHVIDRYLPFDDRTKQWSPLIFAHNVHAKFKWFFTKWDKFKDVFKEGEHWITGNSTHDNARYFYRMTSPTPSSAYTKGASFDQFYNEYLGEHLHQASHNALDNEALTAINLGILPGSPMFFLNATFHTPWLFFRDVEDQYDLKVVADEASRFLRWYISDEMFSDSYSFPRIKALGFTHINQLTNPDTNQGLLDILFTKLGEMKTDSTMVLSLYDDPADLGQFDSVSSIQQRLRSITSGEQSDYYGRLQERIESDEPEALRKKELARDKLTRALKDPTTSDSPVIQEKIRYLLNLAETDPKQLSVLLEDSCYQGDYDPDLWAQDPRVKQAVPPGFFQGSELVGNDLSDFAKAFMFDALELCNVTHQDLKNHQSLTRERIEYNFALRQFRAANPWLALNPTNDIRKDFFNRNIIANGAKHLGGWSDTGEIIQANTVYYGWRTSPDGKKQIFLLANMEGKTLSQLSLRFLIHSDASWRVVLTSPGLVMPQEIDRFFVVSQLRNGQAFLLERDLT